MASGRDLSDSVVVVTGASSGIGRATSLAFARAGAYVVAAARREAALEDVAAGCRRLGADALAVPTDTSDRAAVERLAGSAVDRFGRIDVWVNNAAVAAYGRFDDIPLDDFRRVLDVNLFGYVHGARAVLPTFREQRRGILVNNASIAARVPHPFGAPYVMSKHAVRALGLTLAQELSLEGLRDVRVCTVLPATIDTPLFAHAANYTGRAPRAMPPVYAAERVAEAIVGLAHRPRREVIVGNSGKWFAQQEKLLPGVTEWLFARMVDRLHFERRRGAPPTAGALYEARESVAATVDGGWAGRRRTQVRRAATVGAAAAGGAALVRGLRGR